jgi:hypothetical protein
MDHTTIILHSHQTMVSKTVKVGLRAMLAA